MPRDAGLYVEDMLEAARRLADYVHGLDYTAFAADARTIDAVIRNLEIFGEAAKRVPEEVQPAGVEHRPAQDRRDA